MTLTEFLLARIAEELEGLCDEPCHEDDVAMRFAVADCEAKRRIVARVQQAIEDAANETDDEYGWVVDGIERAMLATARDLALPYAYHPDYDEEWRL